MDTAEQQRSVYIHIGGRIRERRKLLKLNQSQLATMMGFSYQQMQKYETGASQVSIGKLLKFARLLNVSPVYFYENIPMEDVIGQAIEDELIHRTRTHPLSVLLVDDNPSDITAFQNAIGMCCETVDMQVVQDPFKVMDYIKNHDIKYGKPRPDLIILDISLPKMAGMQLLKTIKGNSQTLDVPVVVLTNSIRRKELQDVYKLGAASFILKSADPQEYMESVTIAIKYWSKAVVLPRM